MPEDRRVLERPGPPPARADDYGPESEQVIDWYLPDAPTALPAVVFIHGGYWRPEYDRKHARSAAGALAAAGYPTALIEYRREPGHPDPMVADITSALHHVADQTPGVGVLLVGHSAGGHLALLAATRDDLPVSGVLALAPVSSLAEADHLDLDDGAVRSLLGCSAEERPDLDPGTLPPPRVPVVVVHGEDDSLVPVGMSETYAHRSGVGLRVLPGTGHFELIDPTGAVWAGILTELQGITTATGIE